MNKFRLNIQHQVMKCIEIPLGSYNLDMTIINIFWINIIIFSEHFVD